MKETVDPNNSNNNGDAPKFRQRVASLARNRLASVRRRIPTPRAVGLVLKDATLSALDLAVDEGMLAHDLVACWILLILLYAPCSHCVSQ